MVANVQALFSKIIYPIIFEEEPERAIERVVGVVRNELSEEERVQLISGLKSGRLSVDHELVTILAPICDRTKLVRYFSEIEKRLEGMSKTE